MGNNNNFDSSSSCAHCSYPVSQHETRSIEENDDEDGRSEVPAFSFRASRDDHQNLSHVDQEHQQRPPGHPHASSEVDTTRARVFAAQELSAHHPPSEAQSQLPLLDLHPTTSKNILATVEEAKYPPNPSPCTWLPLTLRWPFLIALLISAVTLGILAIALSAYSDRNSGLCDKRESTSFLFAWRFLPTLIAVLYAQAVTALTNDIKRTEAFAKLSMPNGSPASSSLLMSAGPWWKDPARALSKKRNNGRRSWTLLWISIANIMVMLLVSPLSAGMLYLNELQISTVEDFRRLRLPSPFVPQNTTTDMTYFRTIATTVQDLTTTAWLTYDYAILPIWPAGFNSMPSGASLAEAAQQWQGETSVYQADLECIPMDVTSKNYTDSHLLFDYQFIKLKSADGCTVELNVSVSSLAFPPAGGWWSNTATNSFPSIANSQPPTINQTDTPECGSREMFFALSPLHTNRTDEPVGSFAQLCFPSFFVADNVTATIINSPSETLVSIDEEAFDRTKVALDPSIIDLRHIETQFLASAWSFYFQPPGGFNESSPKYGGPLIPLAATNYLEPVLGNDLDLDWTLTQAKALKRRFFGEALQAAFVSLGPQDMERISSQVTIRKTRLIVGYWIGITLGALLLLSATMLAFAFYCSRLRWRPLNLNRDPGSVAAVMSMIIEDSKIRDCFRGFDKIPEHSMKTVLGATRFRLVNGRIFVEGDSKAQTLRRHLQPRPSQNRFLRALGFTEAIHLNDDWRPAILRRWTGLALLAFLVGLAAALAALFVVSEGSGLHGAALVYQSTVILSSNTVVGLAPYSIVPTVFAVAVKLWWGALNEIFKRLQPYVMMTRTPTRGSRGIGLSYINYPEALATGKAFSRGQWLLALVCLGAFWTEVFTVGMSALWQKKARSFPTSQQIEAQLELRNIPQVFLVPENAEPTDTFQLPVLAQVFENPFESWLYGAVIQMAYNGPPPDWSLDGWSFAPVDLYPIRGQGSQASLHNFTEPVSANTITNVTVETPAVRARIECSPWETLSNTSNWLQAWDLRNTSFWDVSVNPNEPARGYELLTRIELSPKISTTTFANPSRITCCTNDTNKEPGLASIGYWSMNEKVTAIVSDVPEVPGNFTIKWIVGNPIAQQFLDRSNISHLIWQDVPAIAALNCQPVIESANASVTVDMSGTVQTFNILDEPIARLDAWSDNYEGHNSTDPNPEDAFNNHQNVTVSYGILFMDAIANAADMARLGEGALVETGYGDEDLTDRTFNFRLPGLNADYLSYATYALAQQNSQTLLDPSTLQDLAKSAFSTFFQHYAAKDVDTWEGGRAFQPIGTTLPFGLPPITNGTQLSSQQDTNVPSTSKGSVRATVHTHVDELVMSRAAVILCLAILAFLACVTVLVYFPYAAYFKALPRDVETLASVIAFVYDSPKLRQWIAANEHLLDTKTSSGRLWNWRRVNRKKYRNTATTESGGRANGLDEVITGLGFFRGKQGIARWGIEIEPVVHSHPKNPHSAFVDT